MKFILTESQLDNIIFKYLDSQNYEIIKKETDEHPVLSFVYYFAKPNKEYADISVHKWDGYCYIYNKLTNDISVLFSIDNYDAEHIISDWVKSKLKKEKVNVQSTMSMGSFMGDYYFKIEK